MKTLKIILGVFLISALSASVGFGKTYKTGTGGPTGNYFGMTNDIISYCVEEDAADTIEAINTNGSLENCTGLTNKKFSMAIVQEDVLQFMSKKMPNKVNQNRIKVISGLHLETAHLLVPFGYQPENQSKGFWAGLKSKFSDEKPITLSMSILKGQKVVSTGGSVVSLKALNYFLNLGMKVVEMKSMDEVLKVRKYPVFLVGGQPYAPVEKLLDTNAFTLVSIDYDKIKAQAPFYLKSTANYKVKGKIKSVSTFAVRALIVGKSFRRASKNKFMSELSQCITESLPDLADDSDTNANWETVFELENDGAQSGWSYFPLPEK